MPTTIEEIESFREFAKRITAGRQDGPSLEECLRLWREDQELAETIAAVKRGEENFAAGRYMSLDEAARRLGAEIASPADRA